MSTVSGGDPITFCRKATWTGEGYAGGPACRVVAVSGARRPLVGWVEMLSDGRGILVVALPLGHWEGGGEWSRAE
jgi:hypothetical protein